MKVKKLNKKLTLRKETLANLDINAMSGVKGGIETVHDTCHPYCDTYCTCGRMTICECD
jgi:hypothetical protein